MAVLVETDGTERCRECGDEIDFGDGREICEACDFEFDRAILEDEMNALVEEPVWYSLAEVIERIPDLPTGPWQELMALAQILHDLRISDTNDLMRKLGAVYVADDSKTLQGEYHWLGEDPDPDRFHGEIGMGHAPKQKYVPEEAPEPIMSNRRKAIMAQKEKKRNESS